MKKLKLLLFTVALFSIVINTSCTVEKKIADDQFKQLADLAKSVSSNPVKGIAGYKPINSDAGGDLYIMDFIGTLGIPLVPVHQYPENADIIFLPTQAAADMEILEKVEKSISNGSTIIFTTGFLANANDGEKLAKLAGVKYPIKLSPQKASYIWIENKKVDVKYGLDFESEIITSHGKTLLSAGKTKIPFLVSANKNNSKIYTLNTHTFSQADFDKVGEVLLCPKPLGLLEIPKVWVNEIRNSFTSKLEYELDAPTRIVMQPLGTSNWVLHNYNKHEETIKIRSEKFLSGKMLNGFTNQPIAVENDGIEITMKPRSVIWITTK